MSGDMETAGELQCKVGDRVLLKALGDAKVPKYLDDTWAVVARITKNGNIAVEPEADQSVRTITVKHIKKVEQEEPEEESFEQFPQRTVQELDFKKLVTGHQKRAEEEQVQNNAVRQAEPAGQIQPGTVDLFQYKGGSTNPQAAEVFGGFQNPNKPAVNLFMVTNALKQVECRIEDFAGAVNKVFSACGYGYMNKSMVILEDYASEDIDYHVFVEAKGVHDICIKALRRSDKGLLKVTNVWVAE